MTKGHHTSIRFAAGFAAVALPLGQLLLLSRL